MLDPSAASAAELGLDQAQLFYHLESMRERRALRRVAAILYHRRAGFSANGMGVWKVPEGQELEIGRRMAAFREIGRASCRERGSTTAARVRWSWRRACACAPRS